MAKFIFLFLAIVSAPVSAQSVLTKDLSGAGVGAYAERFGMNYFSFWEGPSLEDGQTGKNELGNPLDTGLSLFNLISVTYKLNDRYSLDLQNRIEWIHTREEAWRFQGMRAGISGKLLEGKNWSLKGAINTDVPELNGRDARFRTVLFNPGAFAGHTWNISPRWSTYTILSPRLFFYREDEAVEPEWTLAGRDPGEKPRAIFQAFPTLNFAVSDSWGLRSGLDVQFRQFVESSPGYLRRWPTSWTLGPTVALNRALNLYTFVQTWPFDGAGLSRDTASVGMWLSGVIF